MDKRVLIVIVIILALILAGMFFIKPTGRVSLDVHETYGLEEKLSGNISLTIQQGDVIQKNTPINLELKKEDSVVASKNLNFSQFLSSLQLVEITNSTEVCENITSERVIENCTTQEIFNETTNSTEQIQTCENVTQEETSQNCTTQETTDYYFNQPGTYSRNIQDFIDYTFAETGTYTLTFSVPSLNLSEQKTLVVEEVFSGQEFSALGNGTAVDNSGNVYQCGTINQSGTYTINQSISTTGTCFTILANNVTLDGGGFIIDGDDDPFDYGVYVSGYNSTTIRNFANITDFGSGIYLLGSKDNSIINITTNSNFEYGIYLSTSSNNLLTNITTNSNVDGIRIVSSSNNNALTNITTNSNYDMGILLVSSPNNTLTIITTNSNEYGIYLDIGSNNNILTNNNIWNCTTTSGGCLYLYNADKNIILGGKINLSSDNLIYLTANSDNNVFSNIGLYQATKNDTFLTTNSINNTFLNVSYNLESVGAGSQLIRKWYLDLNAQDSFGNELNSANITGRNSSQTAIFSELTNSTGAISRQESIEYINNGTKTYYTNYNITASKAGYAANTTSLNLTTNTALNLILADNQAPAVDLLEPNSSITYTGNTYNVNFTFNVSDDSGIANCSVYVNSTAYLNLTSITNSVNNTINVSLPAGNYLAYVNCTDALNNIGNSSYSNIAIVAPAAAASTAVTGSGGGGSAVIKLGKTYSITENQILEGVESNLAVNDVIKFTISPGLNNESIDEPHSIKIIELDERNKEVELEIASSPTKIKLKVGEEAKIDLNNDSWYDLLVKFDRILAGKAVITTKSISEKIPGDVVVINESDLAASAAGKEEKPGANTNYTFIIIAVLAVLIAIVAVLSSLFPVRRIARIHRLMNFQKKN